MVLTLFQYGLPNNGFVTTLILLVKLGRFAIWDDASMLKFKGTTND